jgi:hypothetical protein
LELLAARLEARVQLHTSCITQPVARREMLSPFAAHSGKLVWFSKAIAKSVDVRLKSKEASFRILILDYRNKNGWRKLRHPFVD